MRRLALAAFLPAVVLPAAAADADDCWDRLRLAEGGGLIKRYRPVGDGLEIVVAERVWNGVGRKAREGMVRLLNCGLLDDGETFSRILIRSDVTDAVIAEGIGDRLAAP